MYSALNPILRDPYGSFSPVNYVSGTYRMMFIKSYPSSTEEDSTPEM